MAPRRTALDLAGFVRLAAEWLGGERHVVAAKESDLDWAGFVRLAAG